MGIWDDMTGGHPRKTYIDDPGRKRGDVDTQIYTDPLTGEEMTRREAMRRGLWAQGQNADFSMMADTSEEDPSKQIGERLAERRSNYYYGGRRDAAQEAVDRANQSGEWYSGRFDTMSGEALQNANAARNRDAFVDVANLTNASTAAGQMRAQGASLEGVGRSFERFAAQGPGPSAAQAQLNLGTNMALADQLALARSGRGMGESASAMRTAQGNMATIGQNAANQAAILRAQEESDWRSKQLTAMGGAGNAYGAAGSTYGASGNLNLAAGNYYTGANMANRELNDRTALAYGQQRIGATQAGAQADLGFQQQAHAVQSGALQGNMGYESMMLEQEAIRRGARQHQDQMDQQNRAAEIAAGAALGAAVVSDIREKTDIEPVRATSAFDELGKYAGGFATYRDGRLPAMSDAFAERGMVALDPSTGIYRPMGAVEEFLPDEVAAQPTRVVDVGGQRVEKRDIDFDALDRASSDIREKKAIRPADASQAFDMRTWHGPNDTYMPGDVPAAIARPRETYRREDIGKSREQLQREQAFDMRNAHAEPPLPADVVPPAIARPVERPEYSRADVGKSRAQIESENASRAATPASDALKRAPAYSYRYKTPSKFGYENKRYTGPMAQDLASTPEGRTAVTKMPDGSLGVDTGRLALVNASATGEQAQQLGALEREVAELRAMLGSSRPAAQASRMGGMG